MSEGNKALVRRFVEDFQAGGRFETGEELLAHDFRNHTPAPRERSDRDGVMQIFTFLHAILPDLRVEIHDMIADGDRVVTRKTFLGKHPASRSRPGAERLIAIDVMDIVRVRNGQIVEHWNSVDRLAVMRRLGLSGIAWIVADQVAARLRRRLQKCR
ncbi:ester cyclase [Saccharopolyspora karakumensis]|uniref:ester cyclase n=1 Tax=Saccharopolyspora karakumensis TaxID=2530386 RepID=UPI001405584F|nr:ester cyclase [Saccharopolyspora karakumensis]